jgi:hypothetical protein
VAELEREVVYDRLVSGDRPSILTLGVTGAESIRRTRMAVFVVDVLGRVHLLKPEAVQILTPPRLLDRELDELPEDDAIRLMSQQGDSEDVILAYLRQRGRVEGVGGAQDL